MNEDLQGCERSVLAEINCGKSLGIPSTAIEPRSFPVKSDGSASIPYDPPTPQPHA